MTVPLTAVTVTTPVGPLSALVEGDVVRAMGFVADPAALLLRLPVPWRGARLTPGGPSSTSSPVARAVTAYLAGDLAALDRLAVAQAGGPFRQRAWAELRRVKPGTPVSYTELARRAGAPAAVRAAGSACARNAIALVVPCHRVLRSDGTLGGYAYGTPVKSWLLEHERAATTTATTAVTTTATAGHRQRRS